MQNIFHPLRSWNFIRIYSIKDIPSSLLTDWNKIIHQRTPSFTEVLSILKNCSQLYRIWLPRWITYYKLGNRMGFIYYAIFNTCSTSAWLLSDSYMCCKSKIIIIVNKKSIKWDHVRVVQNYMVLDNQRVIGECAVLKSWLKIHDSELMTSAITTNTTHHLPSASPLPISRIPFQWQLRCPIATWHLHSRTNMFHYSTVVERSVASGSVILHTFFNACIIFNTKTIHTVILSHGSKIASWNGSAA